MGLVYMIWWLKESKMEIIPHIVALCTYREVLQGNIMQPSQFTVFHNHEH